MFSLVFCNGIFGCLYSHFFVLLLFVDVVDEDGDNTVVVVVVVVVVAVVVVVVVGSLAYFSCLSRVYCNGLVAAVIIATLL